MRSQCLLVLFVLAMAQMGAQMVAAEPPRDDPVKREMKGLQGRWRTAATEVGGKRVETPGGVRSGEVVIEGDHYDTVYPDDPSRGSKASGTTFTVDPASDPKSIDFLPANDAEGGKETSRPMRGIYKLEKGTLWICFNPDRDGERPTEFATQAGSRVRCVTLKRAAPATSPAR